MPEINITCNDTLTVPLYIALQAIDQIILVSVIGEYKSHRSE